MPNVSNRTSMFRRPTVLSGLGLAACVALIVGLLFPWSPGRTVQAATILERLNEQMAEPDLIELTLDSISVDEVSVDGQLQIGKQGMGGELHVVVTEDAEKPPIEVDLALGLSPIDSWLLIRKLSIPDPDVQPILNMIFPPGSETLLLLPEEMIREELDLDLREELEVLRSTKLVEAFQELIDNQPETGASMTDQRDGTILMTLPIQDASSLEALEQLAERVANGKIADAESEDDARDDRGKRRVRKRVVVSDEDAANRQVDENHELIGSELSVVYDPGLDMVRSFAITGFGDTNGTLSVVIGEGDVDPALLDVDRVTSPHTRVFDLDALKATLQQFGMEIDD